MSTFQTMLLQDTARSSCWHHIYMVDVYASGAHVVLPGLVVVGASFMLC
jgi:hypothetical protein